MYNMIRTQCGKGSLKQYKLLNVGTNYNPSEIRF